MGVKWGAPMGPAHARKIAGSAHTSGGRILTPVDQVEPRNVEAIAAEADVDDPVTELAERLEGYGPASTTTWGACMDLARRIIARRGQ